MSSSNKKSVKLSDEETMIPDTLIPPPPPPAAGQLKQKSKEESLFTSIEMQQQDRFFYEKKDAWHADNPFNDNPPVSRQNTLTNDDQHMLDTTKVIQELEIDQEKQEDREELIEEQQELIEEKQDSDREFDWNDDPDQVKPKRRKTAKERFQAAMKNPCCWHYLSPVLKRIIIALFGSCVFIIVAVVIYFTLPEPTEAQLADPSFTNIRSNVQCWMYWAAFMWHIFWVTTFILDMVPSMISLWTKLFKGRRSEMVKSYMEYYMSLKDPFCLLLLAAWNIGSWTFLIHFPYDSISKHAYSLIVTKVFGSILTACGLYFIQKMIIQYIAFKFHRTAFAERIVENKRSLKILDTLSKSEKKSRPVSYAVGSNNMRKRRSPQPAKQDDKYHQLTDDVPQKVSGFSQIKQSIAGFVLAEKPTTTTGRIDKNKMDINSDDYAKKVAKKLFYALAYPEGFTHTDEDDKKCLDVFDFIPYFKDREEAVEAFKVFDKDGNGDLTRREFRDTVIYIYRERKGLAQAIRDTSQAMGKIDLILLGITMLVTVCICLAIFNVDFWAALIPVGTFLAACTFVFESSASSVFAGIVFQFVTHPYDSGDLVMIDSIYMTVENIGILGTVFIGADGTKLYAPTSILMTKIISNIRRSGSMGETLTFNIDFRTENDVILLLREKLLEWVQSQPRDFGPGFDLRVTDIVDMNQVILTCWLPHKGNWVQLGKRFQRKTRFMLALKAILTDLGIKYELPAQRITSSSDSQHNPFAPQPVSGPPQQFTSQPSTSAY